jgi:hypothetical protein
MTSPSCVRLTVQSDGGGPSRERARDQDLHRAAERVGHTARMDAETLKFIVIAVLVAAVLIVVLKRL